MWRHSKKAAICKATIETSEETEPAHTLIYDLLVPELWGNMLLLYKPTSQWYFVMVALANEYRCSPKYIQIRKL